MVTGTNPGRHGIYDFGVRSEGRYEPRLVTSRDCCQPDMFRLLSQAGKRVGAFNVPLSYPPAGASGFIVTGMHTPHLEAGCYPKALSGEILRTAPDYAIDVMSHWYEEPDVFLADVYRMLEARRKVALHLWRRYRPDVFMPVFVAADRIQHALWGESFPPPDGPHSDLRGGEVFRIYQALDNILGEFLASLEEDEVLFLVSDHGFGPLHKDVYLNALLEQTGLLKSHVTAGSGTTDWKRNVAIQLRAALSNGHRPSAWRRHLQKTVVPLLSGSHRSVESRSIDWSRTRAYSHGMFGNVYINVAGREPAGVVKPGKDYEATLCRLVDELEAFRDPEDGQPVVDHVLLGRDLYYGPAAKQAPDLVLVMRDYAYMTRGGRELGGDRLVSAPGMNHTGNHRLDGCLVVAGQGVGPSGRLNGASIMDICPTVLGLMGAASGPLDGLPLEEVFSGRSLQNASCDTPGWSEPMSPRAAAPRERGLRADERAIVESRLRGLGYLD